ncbi:drebrin-like protein A isoform X2 [Acanthopagrus latus]|uniref:drebrin-like protein A isoform X2 n=1 Tax=Acanthopagrus latus TaxID=8177 RepID=UPI00187BC55D|nr:drebrin-like protein A isoform X2 [Acanthopagrus latus]
MGTRPVNLDTYSLSLLTAKEDILNPRSSTNWAIFTYDGFTNKLKLADSGAGGVAELAGKFHIAKPQYGLCKVASVETGGPRIALISWVGQNVEDFRRTECASHIPAIKSFFKEAHVFIGAEKVEDVTEEKIRAELGKAQAHAPTQYVRRSSRSADKEELVGTNYRKTNAAFEMRLINRESFWARAEREEEERKEEERRRAAEERRRLEKERVLKERRDAEERDRKMNEKLQMIEEQRRKQAEQEEELRRKEKTKWDQQQREHEEYMRARLRRSESIEKAAEAAALVSQRSMNPREFFRQLSSSSSQSPTSPGSSRTGKPFRRYQRSLTDTAFIFAKAEESTASSPRSSPLVSPFSRAPPSPIFRATSPPVSPDFRPVTSPQRPRPPMSPPASPLRPAPPVSALPSVPHTDDKVHDVFEPKLPSPTEPSAPPASPTLLASLSSKLLKNSPSQSHPEALPPSPPNTPTQPEDSTFSFESVLSPQAPTAPLPERPQPNKDLNTATHVHTELVSDIGYKVQAVLVEEDEEEDVEEHEEEDVEEHKEEVAETQPQPLAVTTEPALTETDEQDQEEEEKTEEEKVEEEEEGEEENKEKEEERQEERQEESKENREKEEEGLKWEAEYVLLEEPAEVVQEEEEPKTDGEENSEDVQAPADPTELSEKEEEPAVTVIVSDADPICQEMKHEAVVPSTNGMTNGEDTQEHNGIERSLSPSDTEISSPELAVCYDLHGAREEDDVVEEKEQEITENGQEVLADRQMCVRALYDYQAEDESEISFEPGDIIRDVETVDKAWWRGWSKDGHQGLFPANYVETI